MSPDAGQLDLCFLPAVEQRRMLREKEISSLELVRLHLGQIERENDRVNAIVTLTGELALEEAGRADAALARGGDVGLLHGLPVVHKDFTATAGIRTTLGSPLFAEHVPDTSALSIERLKQAGAVTLGKTNTPEFAAGSHTFNPVFGVTRNPYDPSRSAGGSSGGAAVALACGMAPLADGTDMGGSLRNPASFCNVVGLRPSPGRVPVWPIAVQWNPLIVHGPMGRTVADVALMLAAMCGPDERAPLAVPESGESFLAPLERDFSGVRIAWSRTLGGLPVEHGVTEVLEAGRDALDRVGVVVEEAEPDLSGAGEGFLAWRAWLFDLLLGPHLDASPEQLGAAVRWNIERGRELTGSQLAAAERMRTAAYHRVREFLADRPFLLAPVVQVLPFPTELEYPLAIEGVAMESYVDWMQSCYVISALGLPAASVPFGFTDSGLPVGLQVIGRHGDDRGVLELAHAIEQATQHWRRRPPAAALSASR